ncbi:hypothetical protein VULLAG_LOCUS228 [Vulpes lagopus]
MSPCIFTSLQSRFHLILGASVIIHSPRDICGGRRPGPRDFELEEEGEWLQQILSYPISPTRFTETVLLGLILGF